MPAERALPSTIPIRTGSQQALDGPLTWGHRGGVRYALLLLLANPVAHGEPIGAISAPALGASALGPLACAAVIGLWIAGIRVVMGRQRELDGR